MKTRSPIQMSEGMKKLAFEARFMQKLTGMYESLMDALDEVRTLAKEVRTQSQRIQNLPKGPKGDAGPRGPSGFSQKVPTADEVAARLPKPQDGYSPDITEVAQEVMRLIQVPRDGKDAEVDEKAVAKEILVLLKEGKEFTWKDIPGLDNEISSYRNQLAGKQYGKDTWARGGGDTVSAGSNVTLVRKADGTVEINASGGGSGTNVTTQYQLTAIQAAANVTIALNQLTNFATLDDIIAVYRNNVPQTETLNFTQTPTQITIFNADASEIFNITYAYV